MYELQAFAPSEDSKTQVALRMTHLFLEGAENQLLKMTHLLLEGTETSWRAAGKRFDQQCSLQETATKIPTMEITEISGPLASALAPKLPKDQPLPMNVAARARTTGRRALFFAALTAARS